MSDTNPVSPMTEEQLELVTLTASNAATKAARASVRRWRNNALMGYLALALGVGYAIYDTNLQGNASRERIVQSGRVVAVDGCNGRYDSTAKLRAIFVRLNVANEQQFKAGKITKERRDQADKFYNQQLRLTPLPDCRKAEKLLTDDPDAKIQHIVPKFPPAKGRKG